jgi:hypothetical protein
MKDSVTSLAFPLCTMHIYTLPLPLLNIPPGLLQVYRKPVYKVSFNGLLNAIDGVVAQEGRLVFMTTNHR